VDGWIPYKGRRIRIRQHQDPIVFVIGKLAVIDGFLDHFRELTACFT